MVHFQRFRYAPANLIIMEDFEHIARALSTLLWKAFTSFLFLVEKILLSMAFIHRLRRGMPSHSNFDS